MRSSGLRGGPDHLLQDPWFSPSLWRWFFMTLAGCVELLSRFVTAWWMRIHIKKTSTVPKGFFCGRRRQEKQRTGIYIECLLKAAILSPDKSEKTRNFLVFSTNCWEKLTLTVFYEVMKSTNGKFGQKCVNVNNEVWTMDNHDWQGTDLMVKRRLVWGRRHDKNELVRPLRTLFVTSAGIL